jgi:hypothetical protein
MWCKATFDLQFLAVRTPLESLSILLDALEKLILIILIASSKVEILITGSCEAQISASGLDLASPASHLKMLPSLGEVVLFALLNFDPISLGAF